MQSWSVGIICFNEEGTIRNVFEDLKQVLDDFSTDYEIILVDDASTDGSRFIIEKIAAEYPSIVNPILHAQNQGIGQSIRDVYFNATKENLVFVPGDGQFDVFELKPFKEFDRSEYICFFRQENQTYSVFRNFLSFLNKKFNQVFLGLDLRDVNWVKIYKRSFIQSIDLKMKSSVVESEICAKLNQLNLKPRQIKSTYRARIYGESKGASLINMLRVGKELIKLIFIITKFRFSKNRKEMAIR